MHTWATVQWQDFFLVTPFFHWNLQLHSFLPCIFVRFESFFFTLKRCNMAHMMQTWNFHIKMLTKTQTEAGQTATTVKEQTEQERGKEKEPKKMITAKKRTQQRCVPSAPCRGREHGREMVWIIIGNKSTNTQRHSERRGSLVLIQINFLTVRLPKPM